MNCNDIFGIDATIVANEFIDKYMPYANGDYVKVYLFLLRNRRQGTDVPLIAEKLRLTEGDVRRAIAYWEEEGIVSVDKRHKDDDPPAGAANAAAGNDAREDTEPPRTPIDSSNTVDKSEELRDRYSKAEGKAILNTLAQDDEFGKLMVIVQRYRSKILTEREQEVLAYLYDGLRLPCDVIDYLVEYCVSSGHNSMRYIERTGLDWAEIGIKDVESARRRTDQFEMLKAASSKKKKSEDDKKGMTRKTDLDEWVRARVMETI